MKDPKEIIGLICVMILFWIIIRGIFRNSDD